MFDVVVVSILAEDGFHKLDEGYGICGASVFDVGQDFLLLFGML